MSVLNNLKSHQVVWQQVRDAVAQGRFPQALLLEGPTGVGKKLFAQQIAQFLGCTGNEKPCDQCFHCKSFADPSAVDNWVVPLILESADREREAKIASATEGVLAQILANPYHPESIAAVGTIYVSQIRLLWKRLALKSEAKRVIIIPHAEAMNDNAANALLKNLEEVPPNTHFILTTSHAASLLPTIISRCIPLKIPPLTPAEIGAVLQAYDFKEPSADLQGIALGSAGKAMQYAQKDLAAHLQFTLQFLELLARQAYSPIFRELDTWLGKDAEVALLSLEVLGVVLQDLLRLRAQVPPLLPDFAPVLAASADLQNWPLANIYTLQQKIGESHKLLQERKNPAMVWQNLALTGVSLV